MTIDYEPAVACVVGTVEALLVSLCNQVPEIPQRSEGKKKKLLIPFDPELCCFIIICAYELSTASQIT